MSAHKNSRKHLMCCSLLLRHVYILRCLSFQQGPSIRLPRSWHNGFHFMVCVLVHITDRSKRFQLQIRNYVLESWHIKAWRESDPSCYRLTLLFCQILVLSHFVWIRHTLDDSHSPVSATAEETIEHRLCSLWGMSSGWKNNPASIM